LKIKVTLIFAGVGAKNMIFFCFFANFSKMEKINAQKKRVDKGHPTANGAE
jgi:hypothetical protein